MQSTRVRLSSRDPVNRSALLRLAAVLMLTAWWPLATGNVAGCILACRHAAAAAMPHHHGMTSHAAHHGPGIGKMGPCASVQPLALMAAPAARPALAVRLAVPAPAPLFTSTRLIPRTLTPEPPPPRA